MSVLTPSHSFSETADFPETADIETSSDDYARRFEGDVGRWFLKIQEQITTEMVGVFPSPRVLDVGGGHGQVTGALLENGCDVVILGSAESCRKRVEPFLDGHKCSFRVGNLIDLPFGNQEFDVVISYRLLPHCERWKQLIAELCRVAREAVIVDFPEVYSVNAIAPWLFKWKKGIEKNTRPFTCFKQVDVVREFADHGFRVDGRCPEFFFPMVLHRALNVPLVSAALEKGCRCLRLTEMFGSPVILKMVRSVQ